MVLPSKSLKMQTGKEKRRKREKLHEPIYTILVIVMTGMSGMIGAFMCHSIDKWSDKFVKKA